MKNLIPGLLCLTALLIFGCQKRTVPKEPRLGSVPVATMSLSHTFHGTRCDGSVGLCSVTKGQKNENFGVYAEKIDGSKILLLINRNTVSTEQELKISGKSFPLKPGKENYYIEEDTEIDYEVAQGLGLTDGYLIIKKGTYPMTYDKNFIRIEINLSKK